MRKRRLARLAGAKWTPHPSAPVDWLLPWKRRWVMNSSETQREEISKLVADYLMFEGMERAAPFPKRPTILAPGAWRRAAAELRRVLVVPPNAGTSGRGQGPRRSRDLCLPRSPATPWLDPVSSLENVACFFRTLRSMPPPARDGPEGIIEGERWRHLVAGLAMKFKRWGLPTGIRKDSDKRASGNFPIRRILQRASIRVSRRKPAWTST